MSCLLQSNAAVFRAGSLNNSSTRARSGKRQSGRTVDRMAIGITMPRVQEVDVIGFESGIGFELALPVALRGLQRKKVSCAALDGLLQTLHPVLFLQRHKRGRDGNLFSHSDK